MIPNHLALIPQNVYQYAAAQAIIDVEYKKQLGTSLRQYPYAYALFRHLRGAIRITAKDIRFAAGDYSPRERGGATKNDYIAALDRLIETRGKDCSLPLSGNTVDRYFPDEHYRLSERQNRQWEQRFTRHDKIEAKQKQQKRRRYQTQVAQSQIDLAFTTPSDLVAWYKRQEKYGIYDDDLVEIVYEWSKRFSSIKSDIFRTGQPLWAIIAATEGELSQRCDTELYIDLLMLPNKLNK